MANYTLTLTTQSTHRDHVTLTGAGTYPEGTTVTISATPHSGYYFYQWSKSGYGTLTNRDSATTTFIIGAGNGSCMAYIGAYSYQISFAKTGKGTIPSSASWECGSEHTITATPADGYYFDHWAVSGPGTIDDVYSATATFTVGAGVATVTAVFKPYAANYYNGNTFKKCKALYFDGNNFVLCSMFYYDGSTWINCN